MKFSHYEKYKQKVNMRNILAIREAENHRNGLVCSKRHQCVLFTNDLAIVTRNKKERKNIATGLEKRTRKIGVYISEENTKIWR